MRYHKINTIFKRDDKKQIVLGEFSTPEFEYLQDNHWSFTEKVDGCCLRLQWDGVELRIKGKTDDANLRHDLLAAVGSQVDPAKFREVFPNVPVCLYGEGYGAGVHKGSGNYGPHGFVMFDCLIDSWWLHRHNCEDVAQKLGLDIVPWLGNGTLDTMVKLCREGFNSRWGPFQAEGIVARPVAELFSRKGERIVAKLKCRDFRHLRDPDG